LVLLLSFLPWVDVQCHKETLLTQSGMQAATGGHTIGDTFRQMEEMQKQMGGEKPKQKEPDISSAPLMILWFLVVLAGIGLGVLAVSQGVPFGAPGAAACSGAAALLLLIQVVAGFPVEDDVKKGMKENRAAGAPQPFGIPGAIADMPGPGPQGMPGQPPGGAEFDKAAQQAMENIIDVKYTGWLWLAWLVTLIPPILYGVEWKLKSDLARAGPPPLPGTV